MENLNDQERKLAAKAIFTPMLNGYTELVLSPTLHVFAQMDGLHIAFTGGRKIAYALKGKLYILPEFAEGSQHRNMSAFLQKDIEALKLALKVAPTEFPEDDFYMAYGEHMAEFAGSVEGRMEADLTKALPHLSEEIKEAVSGEFPLASEFPPVGESNIPFVEPVKNQNPKPNPNPWTPPGANQPPPPPQKKQQPEKKAQPKKKAAKKAAKKSSKNSRAKR